MAKKAFFLVILFCFLWLVYSNGNAKDVSMDYLEDRLKSDVGFENMEKCKNRDLMQFMNLDYENYDSYLYYKGTKALSIDELLIIKVKDNDDLSSVRDAIDERIDTQIKTYEGYGPTQVSLLKNAIIKTKGNYLFYSAGNLSDKFEEVFKHAV